MFLFSIYSICEARNLKPNEGTHLDEKVVRIGIHKIVPA